jgi:hypothetical protein
MTPKTMFLAAAAVAAVASAPVAASATTLVFAGTTYTVDAISGGSGSFSGDTVFEFPITSAEEALNFGITATGSVPFLHGLELGTTNEGGMTKLGLPVTLANGASEYFQSALSGVGDWKVFIKFSDPSGTGTYSLAALPPIPEPATWTLMLVGVAGVGGALRRRNRLAVA